MLPILSVNVHLDLAHGRTRVQQIEDEPNGIRLNTEENHSLQVGSREAHTGLPHWSRHPRQASRRGAVAGGRGQKRLSAAACPVLSTPHEYLRAVTSEAHPVTWGYGCSPGECGVSSSEHYPLSVARERSCEEQVFRPMS